MTSFSFWQRWLLAVGLVITVFGIMMALFSGTPLFDLFNQQIDPAFWGANAVGESAKRFQQWLYGVWDATIAGWGIFVTFIARTPFARKERWAWKRENEVGPQEAAELLLPKPAISAGSRPMCSSCR